MFGRELSNGDVDRASYQRQQQDEEHVPRGYTHSLIGVLEHADFDERDEEKEQETEEEEKRPG
jgi:hypothetical protein